MLSTVLVVFSVAVLSGLGVGSAGLLVAWLVFVKGTPQITAQALNLLFFLFSAGTALLFHSKRSSILWKPLLLLIPTGVLGSLLGVRLAVALPQCLLRRLFGILLIVIGAIGVFSRKK